MRRFFIKFIRLAILLFVGNLLLLFIPGFFSCQPFDITEQNEKSTSTIIEDSIIEKLYNSCNQAFKSGDIETIMSFYSDNVERIPYNGETIQGIEAMQSYLSSFFDQNDYVLEEYSNPIVLTSTDWAVTYSIFKECWINKASGDITYQSGRWIVVWEKQDNDSWKIAQDIFMKL